jgi:hypothetical protein
MRSVSRAAAIAVFVVGIGELFARFVLRLQIRRAAFNDDMFLYADTARQLHAIALVLAVAALAVTLFTVGRPGWHWLAWGLFCGWVAHAYLTAGPTPHKPQLLAGEMYGRPYTDLRDHVLRSFDATIPVCVDLLGAVLLTVAVAVHLAQLRVWRVRPPSTPPAPLGQFSAGSGGLAGDGGA